MALKDDSEKNGKVIWLRFFTPIIVTLTLFVIGNLYSQMDNISKEIKQIDSRIFSHLTNDEIHIPRSTIVTKAEFVMHCQFQEAQFNNFVKSLDKFEATVREAIKYSNLK